MKLDRLLSRIRAALQGYATEFEQRALAAEYADACTKAAERLEQVVPLIRQGQDFPALQIAESPPSVLDLVRQLSFAEAEEWRTFCQKHGLPAARPFDERSVDLVNGLYGKKISETHPFYREYRQAIRTRNEDEALRVLQSIRRVNPDDANAHAEFARLAHKLFEQRRVALAGALARNDAQRALALMETVENDGLPGHEQNPTWLQAQKFREEYQVNAAQIRCRELAMHMRQTHETGQWRDALPLLAEWDVLRSQFDFNLPDDIETAAASVREWATGELMKVEKDEGRKKMWHDLDEYLGQLARVNPGKTATRYLSADAAKLAAHTVTLTADAKEGGQSQPPPELMQRLQKESARLQQHLHGRKVRAASIAGTAFAILAGVAAAAFWFQARAQARQTELAAIQQHFKDGATQALATDLKEYDARFSGPEADPAMDTLLTQARDFVNSHQAVVDRFNKEVAQINESATNPSPGQIHQLLAELDKLDKETAGLGADDAQRGKAAVQNLRVRLTQRLTNEQDASATRLADIAKRAGQILADKLSSPMSAESAQPIIAEAKTILAEADSMPLDSATASPAENEARTQVTELTKKVNGLTAAARDALAERGQLAQARTLEDYHDAIAALAKNALSNETTVIAARALVAKNPDWADATQRILMPGDAETWAFLKQLGEARLLPATHNQAEDLAFSKLVGNNVLSNTYKAELVTYVDDAETARTPIYLAGPPVDTRNKIDTVDELVQSAQKINPDGSTSPITVSWKQFTGKKAFGQKIENALLAPESQLVAHVRGAYSRDRDTLVQPLLRELDDIRGTTGVSPILKAYLLQEIFQIMQNRARDWGLTFSPKAQAAVQELAKITGGHLQPADWLFPAPNSRLAANLQTFFEHTAADGYFDDAMVNLQTLLKKRATPLRFIGYVDLSGTPHTTTPASTTLWGLDSTGNWAALYPTNASGQPARLTPLVFPQENGGSGL